MVLFSWIKRKIGNMMTRCNYYTYYTYGGGLSEITLYAARREDGSYWSFADRGWTKKFSSNALCSDASLYGFVIGRAYERLGGVPDFEIVEYKCFESHDWNMASTCTQKQDLNELSSMVDANRFWAYLRWIFKNCEVWTLPPTRGTTSQKIEDVDHVKRILKQDESGMPAKEMASQGNG